MPNIQLAHNLRALREANHLTQSHLSALLNISRQAYSNYETNKRSPDLDTLIHLSQIYHITLDELVSKSLPSQVADEKVPYQLALNIQSRNSLYLTDDEIQMLLKYRRLTPEDRKIIDSFLELHTRA